MGTGCVLLVVCGPNACPWRCEWIATMGVIVASYVAAAWMSDLLLIAAHWRLADTDASSEVEVTLRYSYIAFGVV